MVLSSFYLSNIKKPKHPYIYTYIYIYIYIQIYISTCTYTHIHMHITNYIQKNRRKRIHTYVVLTVMHK
jgi:hypothetical protein